MSMRTYKALFISSKKYEFLSLIFQLVGFDTVLEDNEKTLLERLEDILETKRDEYALIIMPEEYVDSTRPLRQKLREEGYSLPVFLFMPDITDPKYAQLEEIDEMLRKALGMTLKHLE